MLTVYCNKGVFTCNVNSKINDIFESVNVIVTVEINYIEVFQFNIEDKNIINKCSISLNDNILTINNIINNDNFNNDNEILCIEYAEYAAEKFLVCGHRSG